jgi:lipopolysaccharide assembly outer membrane protein LptD (OstA)
MNGPQGVLEGAAIDITYTGPAIARITARGEASLEVENSLVQAATIALVRSDDTIVAQQDVIFFAQPDLVARGARLVYRRARQVVTLEGQARVQNRDGLIEGDRIESHRREDRMMATGNVHGVYRDIQVRSQAAEVFGREKKAVFTGQVELTQPGRRLVTDQVTVWYETRQVVAEGQTRIRLEGQP